MASKKCQYSDEQSLGIATAQPRKILQTSKPYLRKRMVESETSYLAHRQVSAGNSYIAYLQEHTSHRQLTVISATNDTTSSRQSLFQFFGPEHRRACHPEPSDGEQGQSQPGLFGLACAVSKGRSGGHHCLIVWLVAAVAEWFILDAFTSSDSWTWRFDYVAEPGGW